VCNVTILQDNAHIYSINEPCLCIIILGANKSEVGPPAPVTRGKQGTWYCEDIPKEDRALGEEEVDISSCFFHHSVPLITGPVQIQIETEAFRPNLDHSCDDDFNRNIPYTRYTPQCFSNDLGCSAD